MSRPADPYRGEPRAPYPPNYSQQPYESPPPYDQSPYQQSPYGQSHDQSAYGHQPPVAAPPPARPEYRARAAAVSDGPTLRIPGAGLLLTLAGLVVQVLSLVVLPWVHVAGVGASSASMPEIWRAFTENGAQGFGGWYVALFSYPLAALGIVLALATVLQSVAAKAIWAGLTLIGLGVLVLKNGLGPFASVAFGDGETLEFTTPQIIIAIVGLAAVVIVIFMLRMAVSMFRRVAGLILLSLAGVHTAAVVDLVKTTGYAELSVGAFGPALGYVLVAVAAFVGPRKLPGI